ARRNRWKVNLRPCGSDPRYESLSRFQRGTEFVFLRQGQAGGERLHAASAGRFGEGRGGGADASFEAALEFPAFVQAEQHAGAERVARTRRPGDVFVRQVERRLPDVFALARASKTALGKMDDNEFAHALLQ